MAGSDEAVPGWWLAADGRWYPPTDLPDGWEIRLDGSTGRRSVDPVSNQRPMAAVGAARRPERVDDPPPVRPPIAVGPTRLMGPRTVLGSVVMPELEADSVAAPRSRARWRRSRRVMTAGLVLAILVVLAAVAVGIRG